MPRSARTRTIAALALAAVAAALPASADGVRDQQSGSTPSLRDARARAIVVIERTRRELVRQGVQAAAVPGCWRDDAERISCYATVEGVDDGVPWKCSMVIVVRPSARGAGRLLARSEPPLCAI